MSHVTVNNSENSYGRRRRGGSARVAAGQAVSRPAGPALGQTVEAAVAQTVEAAVACREPGCLGNSELVATAIEAMADAGRRDEPRIASWLAWMEEVDHHARIPTPEQVVYKDLAYAHLARLRTDIRGDSATNSNAVGMAQKLLLFWRKPARRCWWEGVELEDVEGVPGTLKVWIRRVWTLEMVSDDGR